MAHKSRREILLQLKKKEYWLWIKNWKCRFFLNVCGHFLCHPQPDTEISVISCSTILADSFYTELFPALMQGNQVEESVLAALDRINDRVNRVWCSGYHHEAEGDFGFIRFWYVPLAAACAQFPLSSPVSVTKQDDTVLDSVAHTGWRLDGCCWTSDSSDHRIGRSSGRVIRPSCNKGRMPCSNRKDGGWGQFRPRIPNLVHRKLHRCRFTLLAAGKDFIRWPDPVVPSSHRLELLQQRVADASPDKLLSRGYSITLNNGKAVTDAASLNPETSWVTRLLKRSFLRPVTGTPSMSIIIHLKTIKYGS